MVENVIIQTHVLIEAGQARLKVRQGETGAYAVTLDEAGILTLYRNQTPLATATWPAYTPNAWHTLRLAIIDTRLTVALNGTSLLEVTDDTPLAPGSVVWVRESVAERYQIDNFWLYLPASDIPEAAALVSPLSVPVSDSLAGTLSGVITFAHYDYDPATQTYSGGIYLMNADGSNRH